MIHARWLAASVLVLAACATEAREAARARDSTVAADSPARPDSAAPVSVTHRAERDLTGDGRAERVVVTATGPSDDSLTVRLEIRSPDDSVLYRDHWTSRLYFFYDPLEGKADSTVRRIVRGHLARLVRDSAFVRPRITQADGGALAADEDAVRHDIAEHEWRRAHGVADTLPLPPAGLDSLTPAARRVPAARVRALLAELARAPSFTYFAGGEATYTVAWSPTERRFVRIFACC